MLPADFDKVIQVERVAFRSKLYTRDGSRCTVCSRVARVYRRSITPAMAAALCVACRYESTTGDTYIHLPRLLAERLPRGGQGGDYAKLRYWGLLQSVSVHLPRTQHRAGWFMLTEDGRRFASGDLAVSKYVWILDDEIVDPPVGYQDESVKIVEALAGEFDYQSLVSW